MNKTTKDVLSAIYCLKPLHFLKIIFNCKGESYLTRKINVFFKLKFYLIKNNKNYLFFSQTIFRVYVRSKKTN
jgi:hypothetical protein